MAQRKHYFLPYMRQGLAAMSAQTSSVGKRVTMPVTVSIEAENKKTGKKVQESFTKQIALWGPGDILGINTRMIVKTEPVRNSNSFEPDLIPFIEFAEPDFLWRFSTRQINDKKNWLPWIFRVRESRNTRNGWATTVK